MTHNKKLYKYQFLTMLKTTKNSKNAYHLCQYKQIQSSH